MKGDNVPRLGLILVVVALLAASCHAQVHLNRKLKSETPSSVQVQAVQGLIARILPHHNTSFVLSIISEEECTKETNDTLCFFLRSAGPGKISIYGTSGVELSAGLYYYLKYSCNASITWSRTGGKQLSSVPSVLPTPNPNYSQASRLGRYQYYQNVCTSSYSMAWWNISRWIEEIDWMALSGINLPLAFVGQEAVYQEVFQEMFGLSSSDLDDFFGGPAFLAWARMGNIHGWGGPLPQTWINQQKALQKQIVQQMRSFGMITVLPGFAGFVPSALVPLYPNASFSKLPDWGHFSSEYCCGYLLDSTDPLFQQIGTAVTQRFIQEFGTDHVYNVDIFNEMNPPSRSTKYLYNVSSTVFQAMETADNQAVWLMQGWLFKHSPHFWKPPQIQAFLSGVPPGRQIILDLQAELNPVWELTDSFYGTEFIWCMLHNFGGNIGQYGVISSVSTNPVSAMNFANSSMVGTGLCPEGIEQNPVMYEMMNEMAWRQTSISDLPLWFDQWALRRYGSQNANATKAWQLLMGSVYNCTDKKEDHTRDIPTSKPALSVFGSGAYGLQPHLYYDPLDVLDAWQLLISCADEFSGQSSYRYDLVDVGRQVLSKLSTSYYDAVRSAFHNRDLTTFSSASAALLGILDDLETLLASEYGFLLGPWVDGARALASNAQDRSLFELNARTQITMWGQGKFSNDSLAHEYANKEWSGLLGDYYRPRWAQWLSFLLDDLKGNARYNDFVWSQQEVNFTLSWTHQQSSFPLQPVGSPVAISQKLYAKYHGQVSSSSLSSRPRPALSL